MSGRKKEGKGPEGGELDNARATVPAPRHRRLAEALDDPKIHTKADALRAAGYAQTTSRAKPGLVLAGEGVQLAIRERREERAASARDLKAKSSGAIAARIADGSASDALLVSTLKTAHDISRDEGDEEPRIDPASFRLYERRVPRAFHRGVLLGVLLCSQIGRENALRALGRVRDRLEDRLPPLPFESRGEAPRHRRYIAGDA